MGALNPGGAFVLLGVAALVWAFSKTNDVSMGVPNLDISMGNRNDDKVNNEKKYAVYVLRDKLTKKAEYVGRTGQINKTEYRHLHNPARSHLKIETVATNIDFATARGLEQQLIIKCNTLDKRDKMHNQINGLSSFHHNFQIYWDAASAWSSEHEVKCIGGLD